MKIMLSILISCIIWLAACKPDVPPEPPKPPVNKDTFILNPAVEMIWVKKHQNSQVYSEVALVTENLVVFSISEYGNGYIDKLLALNKYTGDTAWVWTEGCKLMKYPLYGAGNIYFYSSSQGRVTAVDAQTGQTQWVWDDGLYKEVNGLVFVDGKVYTSANYGSHGVMGYESSKVVSLDPSSGQATVEYTFITADRDGYSLLLYDPTPWHHPDGDLIIFYEASSVIPNTTSTRVEYVAVNVTADSIYLDLGNYFGASTRGNPNVYGDYLYFNGRPNNGVYDWKTGCINMLTRKVIWENSIPLNRSTSGVKNTQIGNVLIGSAGNEPNVNAINASTGAFMWNFDQAGHYTSDITEYMGLGWFCSNKEGIIALNPSDGKVKYHIENWTLHRDLWEQKKEGWIPVGNFSSYVIDPETGYFYTMGDGNYFTCFKIKE